MISAERLETIMRDCLFTDEEINATDGAPPEGTVLVCGIVAKFGFHSARLDSHRAEVAGMLAQLPEDFDAHGPGGGGSFLNACMTRDGEQWTGFHRSVEQLMVLGLGLGLVRYLLPPKMWSMLPGSMPYFAVDIPADLVSAPSPAS